MEGDEWSPFICRLYSPKDWAVKTQTSLKVSGIFCELCHEKHSDNLLLCIQAVKILYCSDVLWGSSLVRHSVHQNQTNAWILQRNLFLAGVCISVGHTNCSTFYKNPVVILPSLLNEVSAPLSMSLLSPDIVTSWKKAGIWTGNSVILKKIIFRIF